jgi:predicted DNA-binding transcriptional regulator AlpA
MSPRATRSTPAAPDTSPEPDKLQTAAPSVVVGRLALRLDELARAIGVSRRAIERERSAGRFPRPDLTIGRMPLWRPETIRAWIEGGGR